MAVGEECHVSEAGEAFEKCKIVNTSSHLEVLGKWEHERMEEEASMGRFSDSEGPLQTPSYSVVRFAR